MSRRRVEGMEIELPCPKCGSAILVPAAKLLDQLPGETEAEYAARMRREWHRETARPRRRSASSATTDRDVADLLSRF